MRSRADSRRDVEQLIRDMVDERGMNPRAVELVTGKAFEEYVNEVDKGYRDLDDLVEYVDSDFDTLGSVRQRATRATDSSQRYVYRSKSEVDGEWLDGIGLCMSFPIPSNWNGYITLEQWEGWELVSVQSELMNQVVTTFANLDDPIKAVMFADVLGPLWLCDAHSDDCLWPFPGISGSHAQHRWRGSEPIDTWLRMAERVKTTLSAIGRLSSGLTLTDDQRSGLTELAQPFYDDAEQQLELDRALLSICITEHIEKCRIRVAVNGDMTLGITEPVGILPAIWRHVAIEACGGGVYAICRGCGELIKRNGTIQPDKDIWCGRKECDRIKKKLSQREARAKAKNRQ